MLDKTHNDIFWGDNPSILFQKNLLSQFFPRKFMNINQKLNAISRFLIYISLVLSFYKANSTYIFLGIIGLSSIWIWKSYGIDNKYDKKEGMISHQANTIFKKKQKANTKYIPPTKCNPFMNPMPTGTGSKHVRESKLKEPQSDYNKVQSDIEDKFSDGLFRPVSDIFGRESSQRQFYTLPNTANASDQDTFAQWLYGTPSTCKEGNGEACIQRTHQNRNTNLFSSI